ncbi:MAG: 16S rRNA (adenine(1518)-N(6)/adenine(1519)-N(6))-dimethyltransferase RsmA [Clostridiales bacterium]|nr:16S rRNA (adenine(1518)-N(6)/adenine(1519)-N(6))-dimethyltransferase RsmA [Clostridiales bacterium]
MEKGGLGGVIAGSGFTFKKKFGQNFLSDTELLGSIVEGAGVDKDTTVIEIGCGAGTLTKELAKRAKFVYGYEIDSSLKPVLAKTLAGVENAEIIFKDFTRVRIEELEKTLPPYKVVANLPYYITTPLIMQLVENSKKCLSFTVMVQEEVADRLCAKPDTPDYGAITANIALRGECRFIKRVGREKFTPSPNVDSAVVRIDLCPCRLPVNDAAVYKKVVRAAFSSRRKTLENNLINGFGISRVQAKAVIAECGFAEGVRGETLSPEQFAALSNAFAAL